MEREVQQPAIVEMFIEANIRRDYWHIGVEDVAFDDLSIQSIITRYLEGLEGAIQNGLGLFLTGDFGHGKSLIASIMLKRALKLSYSAYFLSMFDFVDYYGAFGEAGQEFRKYVRKVDIFCVDDIGSESVKTRDYTFSLLDNLLAERFKPTIFTSNRSAVELKKMYGEHLLEFVGTNKMKEILVDSGKSLRYLEDWDKLLDSSLEREIKW